MKYENIIKANNLRYQIEDCERYRDMVKNVKDSTIVFCDVWIPTKDMAPEVVEEIRQKFIDHLDGKEASLRYQLRALGVDA